MQQLYIHRLRDFCTDFRSGGTSLHPHQQRIRLPSPTLSPALIIIIHSLGRCRYSFHFLKCYTFIGCVCVHVCMLGYMCGGRRTTVWVAGLGLRLSGAGAKGLCLLSQVSGAHSLKSGFSTFPVSPSCLPLWDWITGKWHTPAQNFLLNFKGITFLSSNSPV